MPEKLRNCPLCEKPGIGPYPTGETASLPGALFYAGTTCDHLHVEGMTEEEVVREFNRRPREERLEEALSACAGYISHLGDCPQCSHGTPLECDEARHMEEIALWLSEKTTGRSVAAIDTALAPEGERKEAE